MDTNQGEINKRKDLRTHAMYMSGDMLRSLSESYNEVIEFTEESKKCSKKKGKKCGCKKCKKAKAAATVRYLMPLRGLGYGYGRPGRDDDDDRETNTDGGAEPGGGDAGGGDGGGMSEQSEFEIANIIVEKAADVLDSFSVDEAIDVISAFLEMNGLEMRYSDLAAMLVEMDDFKDDEAERRKREGEQKSADAKRLSGLDGAAKEAETQRIKERDKNKLQRFAAGYKARNDYHRRLDQKAKAKADAARQHRKEQGKGPGHLGRQVANFQRNAPGAALRAASKAADIAYDKTGSVIKGTAKRAAKGISKSFKTNNKVSAQAAKNAQPSKAGKIEGPRRISTRNTSRY